MKYTPEFFHQLLAETYKLERKGTSYNFTKAGYTQKQVAKELFLHETDFNKMVNDNFDGSVNTYKTTIKVLKKQKEIFELQETIETLHTDSEKQLEIQSTKHYEEVALLQKDVKQHSKSSAKPLWAATAVIIFAIFLAGLWLLSKLGIPNENVAQANQKTYLQNVSEISQVFTGNAGQAIGDSLASQAYRHFYYMRDIDHPSVDQKREVMYTAIKLIETTLTNSRDDITQLNYYIQHHKEKNIVEILDHISPRDSIFKCSPEELASDTLPECAKQKNALYDERLWTLRKYLFGKDVSQEEFEDQIKLTIRNAQQRITEEEARQIEYFHVHGKFTEAWQGNN